MNTAGIRNVWGQEKILTKSIHLSRGCCRPLLSLWVQGEEESWLLGEGGGGRLVLALVSVPALVKNCKFPGHGRKDRGEEMDFLL